MDNNKLIGFTLIMLLIVVYYSYFSPNPITIEEDEISEIKELTKEKDIISNNLTEILNENYSNINNDKEETITIENENLVIDFNSKGAKILNVFLKKFINTKGEQVKIYGHKESNINYQLKSEKEIDLDKIIFKPSTNKSDEETIITFKAISKNLKTITISYTLKNDSYLIENNICIMIIHLMKRL